MTLRRTSSTILIAISLCPSVFWCLDVDSVNDVPVSFQSVLQKLEVNLVSLSLTRLMGKPLWATMWVRKSSAVAGADARLRVGINHTRFEKRSTVTNMLVKTVFPLSALGQIRFKIHCIVRTRADWCSKGI